VLCVLNNCEPHLCSQRWQRAALPCLEEQLCQEGFSCVLGHVRPLFSRLGRSDG
jgi:hypothetical protein